MRPGERERVGPGSANLLLTGADRAPHSTTTAPFRPEGRVTSGSGPREAPCSLFAQELLHPRLGQQPRLGALGLDDAEEEVGGLVHIVVHYQVIELAQRPDLLASAGEALLDLALGLGATAAQAALQLAERGWGDEDHHRLRHAALYLPRAHELQLEQYVAALRQGLLHRLERGAVVLTHEVGVLQKKVVVDELHELVAAQEVVLHPVLLALTLFTRGGGDGELQVLHVG